jgi:biopolymer transport protein ExbB
MSISQILRLIGAASLLSLGGCVFDDEPSLTAKGYIETLQGQGIKPKPVSLESFPEFKTAFPGKTPFGLYQADQAAFAIYEYEGSKEFIDGDRNDTLSTHTNLNLVLVTNGESDLLIIQVFESLRPSLSYKQAGVFIYPLGLCLIVAAFVIAERSYSLRRGLTFPRKVEKALRLGEFPDKRWKKGSAAERIVFVAIHEKPSADSLKSYARLEVAALEQGLFLLEVVVAGAPLVGLLGTVTGLVQVFSAMPASGGTEGGGVFSEGIALALLTTIMGLAIAIPALIGHAYLIRVIEKRTASLDWLTARLIDAVKPRTKEIREV